MAADKGGTQLKVRRSASPRRFALFYLFVIGVCLAAIYGSKKHSRESGLGDSKAVSKDPELVWTTLPPSPVNSLVWIPCYQGLQCAKMAVPLDYSEPDGPRAVIAMVKAPAKVPQSDKRYRGPVLYNPGGPGGSGIDALLKRGEQMLTVLGDEYDLVSFDPRGVGRTIPNVNLFPDESEGTRWLLQSDALPLPNSTEDAVARIHAHYQVYGKLAEVRIRNESRYISTALVCRDMLNMMRAHGRDKIQYWGFSYGTVLGATFAAMFPDNVERLVIDGVVDAENYYATLWSNNLVDTDKVLDWFFKECVEAGPELCALHDSSATKIKDRFMNLLASIKASPLPVVATTSLVSPAEYGIVDYPLVLNVLLLFTFGPYAGRSRTFNPATLASALAAAEKGDPVPFWNLYKNGVVEFKCSCDANPPIPPVPVSFRGHASPAILCTDGDPVDDTTEELQVRFDQLAGDSIFGPLWGGRIRCSGWRIRPVERFGGPFVGNTSYPILLIGNTVDPTTPVVNAHKMAKGYNGSVVLTQNSAGHCSLAASSACTARAIRAYFREGALPEPGTVCEVESQWFPKDDLTGDSNAWLADIASDEREAVRAWYELSDAFTPPRYGWQPL